MNILTGIIGDNIKLKDFEDKESVLLNSVGGGLNVGLSMFDYVRSLGVEVGCIGICASAATLPLLASPKRWGTPNSRYMIHAPLISANGNAKELKETLKRLQFEQDQVLDIYVENLSIERDEIVKIMNSEKVFGAEEALRIGLIKEIRNFDKNPLIVNKETDINNLLNQFEMHYKNEIELINTNKNNTNMGLFDMLKGKEKTGLLEFGDVKAIYVGELKDGTELLPVGDAEIKNEAHELNGFSFEVKDNKIVNYRKIESVKEVVNLEAFKMEVDSLKTQNEQLKAEITKSNEAVINMTSAFDKVNATLESLKLMKSEAKPPKSEFSDEHEKVEMTEGERLFRMQQKRDAKAAQVMNQKSNI